MTTTMTATSPGIDLDDALAMDLLRLEALRARKAEIEAEITAVQQRCITPLDLFGGRAMVAGAVAHTVHPMCCDVNHEALRAAVSWRQWDALAPQATIKKVQAAIEARALPKRALAAIGFVPGTPYVIVKR